MNIVDGDLNCHRLLGFDVDGEVELHVPLLLPVFALHSNPSPVDPDFRGVDCYGYGFLLLLQRPVGVGVEGEDAFPEARAVCWG